MNEKIKAAAAIIKDTALQAVADKNGVTVDFVVKSIASGNEGAIRQFSEFLKLGMEAALSMNQSGLISLS